MMNENKKKSNLIKIDNYRSLHGEKQINPFASIEDLKRFKKKKSDRN